MQLIRVGRPFIAFLSAIMLLAITACILTPVHAAGNAIKISIDGTVIPTDADPIIENDRTLVPIATIIDYLGGTSDWDGDTRGVVLKNGSTIVELTIGSKNALVNGVQKKLDAAPSIVTVDEDGGGRTMVPLRFVSESFGYDVDWNESERKVIIDTGNAADKGTDASASDTKYTISSITIDAKQKDDSSSNISYTLVKITADKSIESENFAGNWLTEPIRYYVDFKNTKIDSGVNNSQTLYNMENSYVKSVRTGAPSSGTSRIVIDLQSEVNPKVSYSEDGCTMILSFEETSEKTNTIQEQPPSTDITIPSTNTAVGTYNPYADGKLVVCIDPGHGLTTGGKRSPDGSLREYEFNRNVAYKLKSLLEAQGVNVIMTVAEDDQTDPSLATRVEIANSAPDVDLFVSIHANAFGSGSEWTTPSGWEIYCYKTGGVAEIAAKAIESITKSSMPELSDRGVKTANFYVIKNTNMPAVLIEHGFYTNEAECQLLKSDDFRNRLAQADAEGVMKFFSQYK